MHRKRLKLQYQVFYLQLFHFCEGEEKEADIYNQGIHAQSLLAGEGEKGSVIWL